MDLSAVIFVVLALAWAVYLIPKALQHHDEMAAERLEEPHSDRARVLSRRPATPRAAVAADEPEDDLDEEPAPRRWRRRPGRAPVELSAAGRAARNRRRVLAGLLVVLAAVWALTWFAYLPSLTPLYPSLAVVGWLVLARVSVVRMQRRARQRPARPAVSAEVPDEAPVVAAPPAPVAEQAAPKQAVVEQAAPTRMPATASQLLAQRPEVRVEQEALADDGSLWDPLPLTLPTYVGKATARRTVRTIELTGMTSSGHDEGDSALARDAAATAEPAAEGEQPRRVAGA